MPRPWRSETWSTRSAPFRSLPDIKPGPREIKEQAKADRLPAALVYNPTNAAPSTVLQTLSTVAHASRHDHHSTVTPKYFCRISPLTPGFNHSVYRKAEAARIEVAGANDDVDRISKALACGVLAGAMTVALRIISLPKSLHG